ncbi:hypothetical protein OUZ56_011561 [Daphnia magna]|uniref:Uncharacterized protein n=1 Tax=Daphnia magna TaxID=35525 RepID=A0ABQ9Z0G2_9CRUS|nr:hypothetical protein OUZ56_011561 [Daphnia magna]
MACKRYKSVFVTLEEIGSASRLRYFDLVIEDGEEGGETDCSHLGKAIIRNSPDCTELLENGELTFTIESVKFPGDGRCIKCSVVRGMELAEKNIQHSVLSDTTIEFAQQNIEHSQQTTVPEPVFTIREDEMVGFLNETSSEVVCDFDVLKELSQNEIDCGNLQEKNKSKQKKAVNVVNYQLLYKLPSTFDQSIQQKLKHGEEKLLLNEYATFARDLSRPIMSLTKSPDSCFIAFVVERAMSKYPLVVIADPNDPGPTKRLLVEKIGAICGRQRRKGGGQLSTKGGRPPKVKASNMSLKTLGPGRNHRGVEEFDDTNFD